jgi:signal transduction histidine kinase
MSSSAQSSVMTMGSRWVTSTAISRELHQTAQPLTVLQGLLELALLTSSTTEEYRGVIQRAMEQSQRISGCFDEVRRLFHSDQPALDLSSFSVSDMTRAVVESVKDSYAAARVACEFNPLPHCQDSGLDVVNASEGRVSAALALILSNLPRWARAGGTVEVTVAADSQDVQVRIVARQQGVEDGDGMASNRDLMTAPLQLARTMVTSTGGKVMEGKPEFSLLISLPKTHHNPEMYEIQRIECAHV